MDDRLDRPTSKAHIRWWLGTRYTETSGTIISLTDDMTTGMKNIISTHVQEYGILDWILTDPAPLAFVVFGFSIVLSFDHAFAVLSYLHPSIKINCKVLDNLRIIIAR